MNNTIHFVTMAEQCRSLIKQSGRSYCAFGGERGAGFLGLLVSDQHYNFNGQACQMVYVPPSLVPMSGAVILAAADSVQQVDMKVDDLMKIYCKVLSRSILADKVSS